METKSRGWSFLKTISFQTYQGKMFQCFKLSCGKKLVNLSCLYNHIDENHSEDFIALMELKKAA